MNPKDDMQTPQILVVDDQRFLREMAHLALQHEGYRVGMAANGEEAISAISAALAAGQAIPVILLDMVMPIIDGIEVLKWFSAHPQACERTRIIVITGANLDRLAEEHPVLNSPFVAGRYRKPVQVRDVISLVRSLLPPGD